MTRLFCAQDGYVKGISLGQRLGGGAEGNILVVQDEPETVAKIFHRPSPEIRKKLEMMAANPNRESPDFPLAVAWPKNLVFADPRQQEFAGYLMPRVKGAKPLMEYYHPKTRRQRHPSFDYCGLIQAGFNLSHIVGLAHRSGHVIGDINESNVLGNDDAWVTMVDSDSWQVRDPASGVIYPCRVGKPEFSAAELQGRNLGTLYRTQFHDRFGLAVLLFKLLMEGVHPFDGVYLGSGDAAPTGERIAAGHFPYGARAIPYRPKPLAPAISMLHPRVRGLFVRCFDDGHFDPSARPDPGEWQDALQEAQGEMIQCDRNPLHWHGTHLRRCPWCERTRLMRGVDPFPYSKPRVRKVVQGPTGPQFQLRGTSIAGLPLAFTCAQNADPPSQASRKLGFPFLLLLAVALWGGVGIFSTLLSALQQLLAR